MLAIESYRPSIISPAPGRYVNVGIDRCLCSCSSLLGTRTCSSGGLSSAPQPMSVRSTPKEIAGLTRTILPPVYFTGYSVKKPPLARGTWHLVKPEPLALFPFVSNNCSLLITGSGKSRNILLEIFFQFLQARASIDSFLSKLSRQKSRLFDP